MFIPDPNFFSIPDPGSKRFRIRNKKNFGIFNPKLEKMIWDVHLGYRIRMLLIRKTAVVIPGWADAGSDTRFLFSTAQVSKL
jgi:hypothetical protein